MMSLKQKAKTFTLTKKQCSLLCEVDKKNILLASNRETWSTVFFDHSTLMFKPSLMRLIQLHLIRFSYKDMRMESTKLGKKMIKLMKDKDGKGSFIQGLNHTNNHCKPSFKNVNNHLKLR